MHGFRARARRPVQQAAIGPERERQQDERDDAEQACERGVEVEARAEDVPGDPAEQGEPEPAVPATKARPGAPDALAGLRKGRPGKCEEQHEGEDADEQRCVGLQVFEQGGFGDEHAEPCRVAKPQIHKARSLWASSMAGARGGQPGQVNVEHPGPAPLSRSHSRPPELPDEAKEAAKSRATVTSITGIAGV